MKTIPFPIIKAAKENNIETAENIRRHFDGYITSRCLRRYEGADGQIHTYVDEDLKYLAVIALYAATFRFQFTEPPESFEL